MSLQLNIINKDQLASSNLNYLIESVFLNFNDIVTDELNHNIPEITRILRTQNVQVYLYTMNENNTQKIVAYLIGEIMNLNDGRKVFYITYIFTVDSFRKMGLASKLIDESEKYVKQNNLTGILLTCDTHNKSVYNFYLKKGFMPDLILRNYKRHDVLFR